MRKSDDSDDSGHSGRFPTEYRGVLTAFAPPATLNSVTFRHFLTLREENQAYLQAGMAKVVQNWRFLVIPGIPLPGTTFGTLLPYSS